MRSKHVFAVLVMFAAGTMLAADASAVYHPTVGRFMQRDPAPGASAAPPRIGQYRDGMSLYQYAGSMPTAMVDPSGLTPVKDRAIGFGQFIKDVQDFEGSPDSANGDCCCDRLKAMSDKVRGGDTGFGSAGPASSSGKEAGQPASGLGWKYFGIGQGSGRTKNNWIDLGHFFYAAWIACKLELSESNAGFVTWSGGNFVEGVQGTLTGLNVAPYSTSSSAYSMEDPASNALGGRFGAYYRKVCKEKTVSQALQDFFQQYGPYENPQAVPGYDELETSQQSLEQKEQDVGYLGRAWGAITRGRTRTAEFLGIK